MIRVLLLSLILQFNLGTPSITWSSEVSVSENGENVVVLKAELPSDVNHIEGTVDLVPCVGNSCYPPQSWDFEHNITSSQGIDTPTARNEVEPALGIATPTARNEEKPGGKSILGIENSDRKVVATSLDSEETLVANSLWALILEAILWGLAMLLTPCVFPMVPMTVSFFLKAGKNLRQARFKASMYGLFIVLLYTVPISLVIALTWIFGGNSVTADIFNWLSTHWLPNIIFSLVFLVFAASFFGAFEIVLPSKWTNSADKKSDKAGLGGVFFLALTLVLVSFSCTGPIVGTVLIKSTQGEFWTPMITMLAFSLAFALPFTIFAVFPSLLKKLPKSGSWLNSVKVVLGFIELALGLKFLSTADQTYHWHLLNREIYIALWVVIFTLLGFYLLGKIRFKNDSEVKYLSVKRLFMVIIDFAFVLYLIPGLFGAPLKALSGYLPPMETQEFSLSSNEVVPPNDENSGTITIAHGLKAYDNIEDGIKAAQREGKNIFVDITGHGCVNCREMEARVWSDSRVLKKLSEDFIIVALYVDDKTKIPENQQIINDEGKKLKDIGRLNSYIALKQFGVNSQPNYFILDSKANILKGPRAYNLDIEAYLSFLSL